MDSRTLPKATADKHGAKCLNGNAPTMEIRLNSSSTKWILFLEGGGWCYGGTQVSSSSFFFAFFFFLFFLNKILMLIMILLPPEVYNIISPDNLFLRASRSFSKRYHQVV